MPFATSTVDSAFSHPKLVWIQVAFDLGPSPERDRRLLTSQPWASSASMLRSGNSLCLRQRHRPASPALLWVSKCSTQLAKTSDHLVPSVIVRGLDPLLPQNKTLMSSNRLGQVDQKILHHCFRQCNRCGMGRAVATLQDAPSGTWCAATCCDKSYRDTPGSKDQRVKGRGQGPARPAR